MGLTSSKAWRVAFIVPFILITTTWIGMLLFCQDTPTGKWSERHHAVKHLLETHGVNPAGQSPPLSGTATPRSEEKIDPEATAKGDVEVGHARGTTVAPTDKEIQISSQDMLATARGEVVVAPTFKEACKVIFSLQTAFHGCTYICSFGGELAINSYLAAYYLRNFPDLGQTKAGQWASMFGLLNVFTRPLG
jgi:NNP family nitrate/nitrite transporter-like MFS transporter